VQHEGHEHDARRVDSYGQRDERQTPNPIPQRIYPFNRPVNWR
jgi:hypothetical protein